MSVWVAFRLEITREVCSGAHGVFFFWFFFKVGSQPGVHIVVVVVEVGSPFTNAVVGSKGQSSCTSCFSSHKVQFWMHRRCNRASTAR